MKRKFERGDKVILSTILDGDHLPLGTILTIDKFSNRDERSKTDYYDVKEDFTIGYSENQLRKFTKLERILK